MNKVSSQTFIGRTELKVGDEFDAEGQEWMVITVRNGGIVFARCLGCWDGVFPGVRWPTASNGDDSQDWVERCDYCEKYDSDIDAAVAVALGTGRPIHIGYAVAAMVDDRPGPYVEYKEGGG